MTKNVHKWFQTEIDFYTKVTILRNTVEIFTKFWNTVNFGLLNFWLEDQKIIYININ